MRGVLLAAYLGCLFLLPFRFRLREARKNRQTEELLTLLRAVRREIACFSRPFPEICRSLDLPALGAAGFFDALDGGDARDAFESALPSLSLSPAAVALLRSFFSTCGASVKSEELAACDHAIGRLDELLTQEKRDGAARVKLHSTLLLTGGLLFLLLVV